MEFWKCNLTHKATQRYTRNRCGDEDFLVELEVLLYLVNFVSLAIQRDVLPFKHVYIKD